jgi:hypothetical protein
MTHVLFLDVKCLNLALYIGICNYQNIAQYYPVAFAHFVVTVLEIKNVHLHNV